MASTITRTTSMPSTIAEPWLAYTFAVSNTEAQRLIADLLRQFADIHVRTLKRGKRPLLVVECRDAQRAESLHDVIVTLDWGARLVDATHVPVALSA